LLSGSRKEAALFWTLLAVHLVPLWAFPYFLTQDGPSHLENANLLRLYSRPDAGALHVYFTVNARLVPNLGTQLVTAALLTVASPRIAEKLLLSVYVLLLPLSFRYAARAARPEAGPLAILGFPLVYNCLLQYGFYNFCFGIAGSLFLVGYWYRHRSRATAPTWTALAALSLAVYFCHVACWGFAVLAILALAACDIAARRLPVKSAAACLTALAPALVLAILFIVDQQSMTFQAAPVGSAERWRALWHFSTAVFSYAYPDQAIGTALAIFYTALGAIALFRRQADRWIVPAAIALLLYFIAPPATTGGLYVLERIQVYFFLLLALWIGTRPFGSGATVAQCCSIVLAAALLGIVVQRGRELNRHLDEYLSAAGHVAPGSTLLPLQFDSRGPGALKDLYGFPFRHVSDYIAADRHAINLDNYEAQTNLFPLKFRDALSPGVYIAHIEDEPPSPSFIDYSRKTPGRVDYVLLWDPLSKASSASSYPAIMGQLRGRYDLVFASPQDHVRLYGRRTKDTQ
jgi:hypothetical protein